MNKFITTSTKNTEHRPLTLADIERAFAYLTSDEYAQQNIENARLYRQFMSSWSKERLRWREQQIRNRNESVSHSDG